MVDIAPFLSLNPSTGVLILKSNLPGPSEFQSHLNVTVIVNSRKFNLLPEKWEVLEIKEPVKRHFSFGTVKQTQVRLNTVLSGVTLTLFLGVATHETPMILQLEVNNLSEELLILEKITLIDTVSGDLRLSDSPESELSFYSQGWQSWSSTGAYRPGEKQRASILGLLQNPMVVNPGTPQPKGKNHFSGDMVGLLGNLSTKVGWLAGFLSQKQHFGSLEGWLDPQPILKVWANGDHVHLPPGSKTSTDPLWISFVDLGQPDPFGAYLEAVALENGVKKPAQVPVGWCSWYQFYQNINSKNINANLDSVVALQPDLPLPLFQIDDGFETYPGDWYDFTTGFPHGLRPIVDKARAAGLIPGLWLAPFIVHPRSRLVKEHPGWLLRDEKGKPVKAGFVWNSLTLALDLTNPAALAYTCEVIRTAIREWGFEYLKLDFLYAAALDGVYQDPTLSRAQVLRLGLEALRDAAGPDITMLACGCPLGSALGLFEAMRVSADVNGYWEPHFAPLSPILRSEPHMPSARNAIHNILTRAPLHKRWWINDPDCLLVRPDTHLSLAEVQSLATAIGLTGGSILVSDDLPQLPPDRLRLAQILLPVIGQRALVMDLLERDMPACLRVDLDGPTGPWNLLAHFNWSRQPADLAFSVERFGLSPDPTWWLREFWTGATGTIQAGKPYPFENVPSHGVRVAAVRQFDPDRPMYIGSDMHLSQGLEVSRWQPSHSSLAINLELGHTISGIMQVYLPWQPKTVHFNGKSIEFRKHERDNIYTLHLTDADGKEIFIRG